MLQQVNETKDIALTGEPINNATKWCRLTKALGGHYLWEWPERCDLWHDWQVKQLTSSPGYFATVAASAVGWAKLVGKVEVSTRKK